MAFGGEAVFYAEAGSFGFVADYDAVVFELAELVGEYFAGDGIHNGGQLTEAHLFIFQTAHDERPPP